MELLEWVDPITQVRHTCPMDFTGEMYARLGEGAGNAKLATRLLEDMGLEANEGNRRHLRKAAFIMKRKGFPVISIRSAKGGYFLVATPQEIKDYVKEQRKLAFSMLEEAAALEAANPVNSEEIC